MDRVKILSKLQELKKKVNEDCKSIIYELEDEFLSPEEKKLYTFDRKTMISNEYPYQFAIYMEKELKLNERSIKHYFSALGTTKSLLCSEYSIVLENELYVINNLDWYQNMISLLYSNDSFHQLNSTWHNMLTAANNNYIKFLKTNSRKQRVVLSKRRNIYFNFDNKIIGRVPTSSNLKQIGSDNSLYLGQVTDAILVSIVKSTFSVSDMSSFDKSFEVMYGNKKVVIDQKINDFGQIQLKFRGDGLMYSLLNQHKIVNQLFESNVNYLFLIDLITNKLTIINESECICDL